MAKVSRLKAVEPKSASPSKPKILIFGRPGVGKTWTSLDFPACYYIDTEGGANLPHYTDKLKKAGGVYFGPEQGSQDFREIIEQVKALATEDHPYKTLVIDSISKIFNAEISHEYESMEKAGRDMGKTFGAEKKPAVNLTKRLIDWLDKIDMNVILIAHEKPEWLNEKQIGVTFDCHDKLGYELHLCLNIIKTGDTRKAVVKKSRLLGFPDAETFEWSYAVFSNKYGKDVMEAKSKAIILATSEQVLELNKLLETVKLPEGETDKWLKKAGVETFEDMDSDKIAKCIAALRAKISPPIQVVSPPPSGKMSDAEAPLPPFLAKGNK